MDARQLPTRDGTRSANRQPIRSHRRPRGLLSAESSGNRQQLTIHSVTVPATCESRFGRTETAHRPPMSKLGRTRSQPLARHAQRRLPKPDSRRTTLIRHQPVRCTRIKSTSDSTVWQRRRGHPRATTLLPVLPVHRRFFRVPVRRSRRSPSRICSDRRNGRIRTFNLRRRKLRLRLVLSLVLAVRQ